MIKLKSQRSAPTRRLPKPVDGWCWGVDLSEAQGEISPDRVRALRLAGCSFVIAKATDGQTGIDREWKTTSASCVAAEMPLSAYYVFEPSADPEAEAAHFVGVLGDTPLDFRPWLDFEIQGPLTGTGALRKARRLVEGVEDRLGVQCGIYSGPGFFASLLSFTGASTSARTDAMALSTRPLWVADYGRLPGGADPRTGMPRIPSPWTGFALWQASGDGGAAPPWSPRVSIDVDWFRGTVEDLLNSLGTTT